MAIKQLSVHNFVMNRWVQISCNSLLLLLFAFFILTFVTNFLQTHHLSALLYVVLNVIMIAFCAKRRFLKEIEMGLYSSICAFAGAFFPLMAEPGYSSEIFLGYFLQCVGVAFSIAGIFSLNKSFGILPANRGIISGGLYKFVRHPLYFSYELSFLGFLINNCTIYNISLFLFHLFFQIQRIAQEERLLNNDPEYRNYCLQTRWRIFPYIY